MELTLENLEIREMTFDILEEYFKLKSNIKAMKYHMDLFSNDYTSSSLNLTSVIKDQNSLSRKKYYYSLFEKNTDKYLGQIGYKIISTMNEYKLVEILWFYHDDVLSNYKKEALDGLLYHMINYNNCLKIISKIDSLDLESKEILENSGFVFAGDSDAIIDSKSVTILEYKITKPIYLKKGV